LSEKSEYKYEAGRPHILDNPDQDDSPLPEPRMKKDINPSIIVGQEKWERVEHEDESWLGMTVAEAYNEAE